MNIKVIFEGFSLTLKITRIDDTNYEIKAPAFLKGQIPWDKLKIGDHMSFNLGSLMKGMGGFLEKFK